MAARRGRRALVLLAAALPAASALWCECIPCGKSAEADAADSVTEAVCPAADFDMCSANATPPVIPADCHPVCLDCRGVCGGAGKCCSSANWCGSGADYCEGGMSCETCPEDAGAQTCFFGLNDTAGCAVGGGGTSPEGAPCTFPFTYNGAAYNECILAESDYPWCLTADGGWGDCTAVCPGGPSVVECDCGSNLARVEVKEVCCSGGHIVAAVIITVFCCGALTAKKNDQGVGVRQ